MIIIDPAFCGVDPRVSTTWQTISSRSCSRPLISSCTRSRMRFDSRFKIPVAGQGLHSVPSPCQANGSMRARQSGPSAEVTVYSRFTNRFTK